MDIKDPIIKSIQSSSLFKMISFLAHPYPVIRLFASETLYLLVSSLGMDPSFENILVETKWDAPVKDCLEKRDLIKNLLNKAPF